jgi:hypothetical protein
VPAASELFTIGPSMAVLSPASEQGDGTPLGPWSLRVVKGKSTSLGPAVALPFLGSALRPSVSNEPAAVLEDFWVANDTTVFLVDTLTGAIERRVSLGADITSISVDSSGDRLYAGLGTLTGGALIDEIDATTGNVTAHHEIDVAIEGAGVDAVPDGVWVSYRGGMLGLALLLGASNLASVSPPNASLNSNQILPTAGAPMTMGVLTTRVGNSMWLDSTSGASCVNPATGLFLAGTPFGTQGRPTGVWSPVTQWAGRLYATQPVSPSDSTEILRIKPPANC